MTEIPFYDSLDILSITYTDSDWDGIDEKVKTAVTTECRVTDLGNSELNNLMKMYSIGKKTRKVYLPAGTIIAEENEVEFEGETWRVIAPYRPRWESDVHHIKVYITTAK